MKRHLVFSTLLCLLALLTPCSGQVLFEDNFNTDTFDDYDVYEFIPGRDGAEFLFDYGDIGIPTAPNSGDDSTLGVRLYANNPFDGTGKSASGVQIVPFGLDLTLEETAKYDLTFDVWMNANGPLPGGGGGSTEAMMAGVGFSGDMAIEAGNIDGTYFTVTGEGGSSTDLRSFTNDGFNQDGINVAPKNTNDPFYADLFPGGVDVGALPIQGGQDNQTGVTIAGQMAFEWHEVRVSVDGVKVEFFIDDVLLAHDEDADIEGNVVVGNMDYFSSESDAPQWSFTLIDNLKVAVPEDITFEPGDFNEDGSVDGVDLNSLCGAIAGGNAASSFDISGDGTVNGTDVSQVLDLLGSLPGDADLSGDVGFSDFLLLSANFGGEGNFTSGDFDCTGDVQFSDFLVLSSNFGTSASAAANSVPEPGAVVLSLFGCVALGQLRRRR